MAKVDIIMGVYNCEKYIDDSIQSIIKQSFKEWRLIICDDKSTDGTLKIAMGYAKKYPKKILVLKNASNMGLNYTLNKCIEKANAKYIARQDGDDTSEHNRLQMEVAYLDSHDDVAFVSTNASLFDECGAWGKTNYLENPNRLDFLNGSPFCHAAAVIRRRALDSVGGYTIDNRLLRVEDYHLWFKLYSNGMRGHNLKEYLYNIRDDRDAMNRRTWRNRMNEYYVRKTGYAMLNIPWYLRFHRFKPIVLGLLPKKLYLHLHRKKLKEGS